MSELPELLSRAGRTYRRVMTERAAWFDAAVGGVIAVIGITEAQEPGWGLAALGLGAAIAMRRRWPLAVFLVVFAIISAAAHWMPFATFTGVLIAGYSLAAYGRSRLLSFLVLFASAVFVTVVFSGDLSFLPQASTGFIVFGTLWLAGSAIRSREQRADESEARAARVVLEQQQAHELALAGERARIARELHDVVTHHVSVMVVQAGAARHVMERSPERAAEALLAVEARGREALAELRGFLGVLDGSTGQVLELAPQPGSRDIEALVRGVAGAGLPVSLTTTGAPPALPQGVDLAAYRVVQEALTNALKYAEGARTEVLVAYGTDEVRVEVLDRGPGRAGADAGDGRGLTGLRERLALYGGRLEAGRRPSGGFAVRATIPIVPAA